MSDRILTSAALRSSFLNIQGTVRNWIKNCYDACTAKGATIPQDKTLANLASCIGSIVTTLSYNSNDYTFKHIKTGTFTGGGASGNDYIESRTISIGFKPKFFMLFAAATMAKAQSTTSIDGVVFTAFLYDDDAMIYNNSLTWKVQGGNNASMITFNNNTVGFSPSTANGGSVVGFAGTNNKYYFGSGVTFKWLALG